ncbi:MAG: ThuA domain-containing protein [Planctomycetes bacterium]|nr:ThuA domain-containing protein [Planctomycetota bacterium]
MRNSSHTLAVCGLLLLTGVITLTIGKLGTVSAAEPPPIKALFLGDKGHHRPADRAKQLIPVLAKRGIDIRYTDDVSELNLENLKKYQVLIVYANIDKISPEQAKALLDYVAEGGGFVPLHCASFCFRNSPEVVALIGGQFKSHGTGVFRDEIVERQHPIMKGFDGFESWDETYVHSKHNPQDRLVLSYRVDKDVREPYTWVRTQGKGRVFYTAWGHDERTWANAGFQNLVERGIRWAAGLDPGVVPAYPPLGGSAVSDALPLQGAKPTGLKPFEYVKEKIAFYPPPGTKGTWDQMQLPLSPAESAKHLVLPEGFEAKLFVSEPELAGKPICMNWDDRGRLWVVESLDYPNELQKEGEGRDRIRICEDTDGDGRADKFTVFAEKLSIPTSLLPVSGGVIVHQAPQTLFLKDTNGDDKADEKHVLINGWGTSDTHAGPSNLNWGLDNWVWGCVGYSGFKGQVGDKKLQFAMGFYRFRPDGSQFEFLCSTNNNTWGLGRTEDGCIVGSTANNCPSVYMAIPNRYYENVPGMAAKRLETIAETHNFHPVTDKVRQVDAHGRYTAGAGHAVYTARTYPSAYWNRVAFVSCPTGHLTGQYRLERQGSQFISRDAPSFFASDDEWTAPIMAEVGPDGNVWVIDWYNYIVQHNPTPRGFKTGKHGAYETPLRDKKHGRIYRIVHKDSTPTKPLNLEKATPAELVAALKNDNMLWRIHAQRRLVQRGQKDVVPALVELVRDNSVDPAGINGGAIHALWTLHGLGALAEQNTDQAALTAALAALRHPSYAVRRNAVQVLPRTEESLFAILSAGLLSDSDAQVRLMTLLALSEMPRTSQAGAAIYAALLLPENFNDRWIPDAATAAAARHDAGFIKAILGASGGAAASSRVATRSGNLLSNGSFEIRAKDQPVDWQVRNYVGPAVHRLVDGGRMGRSCVEIQSTQGSDTSWAVTVAVKPNTNYLLTGWIKTQGLKTNGSQGALLNIHELQQPEPVRTAAVQGTTDWTPVSVRFNTGSLTELSINCLFGGWGLATGTAWFDDLTLAEEQGAAVASSSLNPAVDRALRLVAANYARRGAVESVVSILASLKGADPQLAAALLDGLVAGWPQGKSPELTPADRAELAALMAALPANLKDRLLALADRFGQRDIFSGNVKEVLGSLNTRLAGTSLTPAERVDAAERLVRLADTQETIAAILKQIDFQAAPPLVQGLLEAVAASRQEGTGAQLVGALQKITPASRRTAISVLLRRPAWTDALLTAVEKKSLPSTELSDQAWQQLTSNRDAAIAERAKKAAGTARLPDADRQKVIESLLAEAQRTGEPHLGQALFEKKCAQCHTMAGKGGRVGPDLTGIGRRAKPEILAEIIDPNRSVEANFRQWRADTNDGLTFIGLLAAESQTTVEIVDVEGKSHVIARKDLSDLMPSNLSVMPVGLEKDTQPGDFANLLEYLSRSKVAH